MKKASQLLSASLLVACSVTATESTPNISGIETKLGAVGLGVKSATDTPIAGLKQVITDRGVFYTSADGQYIIQGALIDLDNRINLTDLALNDVRKEGLKRYAESAIEYKAKNEQHVVTVFTDITCGYCRKLHRELEDYLDAGITLRYMAFPRGGIQGQGYQDLVNVWCSKDKQQAMTDAKAGEKVPESSCSSPIAEHYQLGQSFGISATPALVFSDGTLVPGYQPAKDLKANLDQMLQGPTAKN